MSLRYEEAQALRRDKSAAELLAEAATIRELVSQFGGTSEEKLWSPAEMAESLRSYARNREMRAIKMLVEPGLRDLIKTTIGYEPVVTSPGGLQHRTVNDRDWLVEKISSAIIERTQP